VHRGTVEAYEQWGSEWAARRKPVRRKDARAFGRLVAPGKLRVDLGCGAGRYTADLGEPVIAIDAAASMVEQCRLNAPRALLVRCDLEALPFAHRVVHGAWANMSYLHLPGTSLPMALAELQRVLEVGSPIDVQVLEGDYEGDAFADDDVGGRFFCAWSPDKLVDVVTGAGFEVSSCVVDEEASVVRLRGARLRSLPDYVGADMELLVVGLNPSLRAADAGVGYVTANNRFWNAAIASGLVTRDRDPRHALASHRVGMTDLVKRATANASGVGKTEYKLGMQRLERLVEWLSPAALCMVGLSGWRAAVDAGAAVGVQDVTVGGRPVYVMPSTSGANAHVGLYDLTEHLRAAKALASRARPRTVGRGHGVV
jgi:TDG/mug DNA glycosylase family protein